MKNNSLILFLIAASALLSACVTINIYFPAAAAEKAADKIIEEVWQLKNKEAGSKPAETTNAPAEKPTQVPANAPAETPSK